MLLLSPSASVASASGTDNATCRWSWKDFGCVPRGECSLRRPRLSAGWCRPVAGANESCAADLIELPPDDPELRAALQLNAEEHDAENAETCRHFYCGPAAAYEVPTMSNYSMGPLPQWCTSQWCTPSPQVPSMSTHSMGPLPLNDYPDALTGVEHIHVSRAPLFSAGECDRVVA